MTKCERPGAPPTRIAELVHQTREAIEYHSGQQLRPLPGPATVEEITDAEEGLEIAFPPQLRELYETTSGGYLGLTILSPIGRVASVTDIILERWDEVRAEVGEFLPHRENSPSTPPQGKVIGFGSGSEAPTIFIEADGPEIGRIVLFDAFNTANPVWGHLADDLEGFLTWGLRAAELGAITVGTAPYGLWPTQMYRPRKDHLDESSQQEARTFDQIFTELWPAIDAAGGTGAYFGVYEHQPNQEIVGWDLTEILQQGRP